MNTIIELIKKYINLYVICPSCKKAFEIDQAGFSDIVKQVRDDQFDKELKILVGQAEKEKEREKIRQYLKKT